MKDYESGLLTLRASTKRALLPLLALVIGYLLGFQNAKVFASPVLCGFLTLLRPWRPGQTIAAFTSGDAAAAASEAGVRRPQRWYPVRPVAGRPC